MSDLKRGQGGHHHCSEDKKVLALEVAAKGANHHWGGPWGPSTLESNIVNASMLSGLRFWDRCKLFISRGIKVKGNEMMPIKF